MTLFATTQTHWRSAGRSDLLSLCLVLLLIALMLASLTLGRYPLSLREVAHVFFMTIPFDATGDYADKPWVVTEIIRMPRILLVTICGMGLALSGATMQGVFRNPLVGPEIAGVTAGASLGGVSAIMLGWSTAATVGMAFGSGLLALFAAFSLAMVAGRSSTLALVLSGVVVGGFCSSITGLLQTMADPNTRLPSIMFWLLGSFVSATYDKVLVVSAITLFAGTLILLLRWRINLLSLGDADARALGLNVDLLRWVLMALVAVIVAAQVSVSGGIGWVGLIVPHLARLMVGPDHTRLLPVSAILGGIYLLVMDDIARSAAAEEIPIGFLTSIVGTPIFAFLFWRLRARSWTNA
ncbi:iron ABC transporter permease [Bradyrhizobium sp. dw_411]|uniref:FecCD family ABC transporter permease n=1 Tax=Bradyrhizobium sp. dw_411 TaxID=2720082 RepID=UPI001BCB96E9|nr:iron ABC transporter permease [Bradyrhizobium sp. dw_411]